MRRTGFWALAALLVAPAALAAQWPEPYRHANTAGRYLEGAFSGVMQECGLSRVRENRTVGYRDKSSIPPLIRQVIPLNEGVITRDRESAARVFYYIWPTQRIGDAPDVARYLVADMEAESLDMLAPGFTRIAHTHTCSSVLSAAASANLNIPPADLKAALEADYSGKKQTVLAVVGGTFFSPLSTMLNQGEPREKSFAQLMFWEWYTRNPALAAAPQYYIARFDGLTIYQLVKSRKDAGGKVSLEGGFASPVASVRARLAGELLTYEGTDVTAFGTAFYRPSAGPKVEFARVPTPAVIAADISRLRPTVAMETPVVLQGIPHIHTLTIEGMPASVCTSGAWEPTIAGFRGTLALNSAAELESGMACQFAVSLVAEQAAFSAATPDLQLTYKLRSVARPGGAVIEFEVGPLNLTASKSPLVALGPFNPNWGTRTSTTNGNTSTELIWQVAVAVDDRQNKVDVSKPVRISDGALVCDQVGIPVQIPPQVLLTDQRTAFIPVTHPVFAGEDLDLQAAGPARTCSLSATLDLQLSSGSSAIRSLPAARLAFPPRVTPPPAAVATMSTPPNASATPVPPQP